MWMLPLPLPTPPAAIVGADVGAESGQHSLVRTPDSVDIAPGDSVIAIKLDNPRNVSVTLSLDDPVLISGGTTITCEVTQNGAGEALVAIRGAALHDELSLTLRMWAYDRDYDPYTFTARCPEYTVSFDNQGHGTMPAAAATPLFGTVSDPGDPSVLGIPPFLGWYKEPACTTPWDFAADTVTGGTTLYAKWGITYTVGQTGPAGGIIFYVDQAGFTNTLTGIICHYLEAAPADIESPPGTPAALTWSPGFGDIPGTAGTAVGTGPANTAAIIAAGSAGGFVTAAAQACADYGNSTAFDDWFLPSKGELYEIWDSGITGTQATPLNEFDTSPSTYYWSSSQDAATNAWRQKFSDGSQSSDYKNRAYYVRAIRAF